MPTPSDESIIELQNKLVQARAKFTPDAAKECSRIAKATETEIKIMAWQIARDESQREPVVNVDCLGRGYLAWLNSLTRWNRHAELATFIAGALCAAGARLLADHNWRWGGGCVALGVLVESGALWLRSRRVRRR